MVPTCRLAVEVFYILFMWDSLVEEHDVRFPDLVGRQPQHADAAVVRLVPLQLVVVPHLNKIFLANRKNIFVRIKCNRKSVQKWQGAKNNFL